MTPDWNAAARRRSGKEAGEAALVRARPMAPIAMAHRANQGFVSEFRCPSGATDPSMSSDLIKHISDDSFDSDVLKSDKPVLVDYWAEWCGPCKAIAPILDEVSRAYDGRVQIAKMNVDENREVPAKFGIRGIPTLMLFKDGELAATKVGALSKAQLTAFLDGHI
jgi:thioredoxin 1